MSAHEGSGGGGGYRPRAGRLRARQERALTVLSASFTPRQAQQRLESRQVGRFLAEPCRPGFGREDRRHPVMQPGAQFVRLIFECRAVSTDGATPPG
jgi:hypothetical protein